MAYIGRSGWNDLAFDGQIPDDELLEAVDESYRLVVEEAAEEAPPRRLGRLAPAADASGRPRARPRASSPGSSACRVAGLALPSLGPSSSLAWRRWSFSTRASMIERRLATTRARFAPVGISTKIGQTKPSWPAMNQIAQHDQVGDQEPEERLAQLLAVVEPGLALEVARREPA